MATLAFWIILFLGREKLSWSVMGAAAAAWIGLIVASMFLPFPTAFLLAHFGLDIFLAVLIWGTA